MEEVTSDTKYFLGKNDFNDFEIIEHQVGDKQYEGTCVFSMIIDTIGDGDGSPATYDSKYVEIPYSVREHAMEIMDSINTAFEHIVKGKAKPIDRALMSGDCIYDGDFYRIHSINDAQICAEQVYYTSYDAGIDESTDNILDSIDEDKNTFLSECQLIPNEIYEQARNAVSQAISHCRQYLQTIYQNHLP